MRRLHIIMSLAIAILLAGCGSATEVGNPTGSVPTRTLTGTVDTSSIPDDLSLDLSAEYDVSPTEFTVIATAPAEDEVEAPLAEDGGFTITVRIRTTYRWELWLGGDRVGYFIFEQINGLRRNTLRIENQGDTIDMGTVRFEGGALIPENEPIEQDYWISPVGPLGEGSGPGEGQWGYEGGGPQGPSEPQ